jgi:hypothetical protein
MSRPRVLTPWHQYRGAAPRNRFCRDETPSVTDLTEAAAMSGYFVEHRQREELTMMHIVLGSMGFAIAIASMIATAYVQTHSR